MRRPHSRSQAMVEAVILIALIGIAMAFLVTLLPDALKKHYQGNQRVLASPL